MAEPVSNPGPLALESDALPTALRGLAWNSLRWMGTLPGEVTHLRICFPPQERLTLNGVNPILGGLCQMGAKHGDVYPYTFYQLLQLP